MSSIKIRAKHKDGITQVKCLISHVMETGLRKTSKGEKIPAHFIQEVTVTHKDDTVMTSYWNGGVSKNPYLSCKFKGGAAGEEVTIAWIDNKGNTDTLTAAIK